MRTRVAYIIAGCVIGLLASTALAQSSGGQICVRSFDDRNGNSIQDPGEPLITRGVAATLSNAEGVIVQTALLDDSPQAAQGILCFQRLPAGQYTVDVTSADYTPTTATSFVTSVSETSIPQVFDFGAQVIRLDEAAAGDEAGAAANPLESPEAREALLQRLLVSTLAGGAAVALMAAVGAAIYFVYFRPRLRAARQAAMRATGAYPAARPTTGAMRPVTPTPTPGAVPPVDQPEVPSSLPGDDTEPPIDPDDTSRFRRPPGTEA